MNIAKVSYTAGDLVTGSIKVESSDGSAIDQNTSFDVQALVDGSDFGSEDTLVNNSGIGYFAISLPSEITQDSITINVIVTEGANTQSIARVVQIIKAEKLVINFYPESGHMVYGCLLYTSPSPRD